MNKLNAMLKKLFIKIRQKYNSILNCEKKLYSRRSNQRLIIEFVAPPGSGKSTIIKAIKKRYNLRVEKIAQKNYFPKSYLRLEVALGNFASNRISQLVGSNGLLKQLRDIESIVNVEATLTESKIYILDETGIVRKAFRGFDFNVLNQSDLIEILRDRVLVKIAISPDQIVTRIRKRHAASGRLWGGHSNKSDMELYDLIQKQQEEIDLLCKNLQVIEPKLCIVEVSSSSLPEAVDNIVAVLDRYGAFISEVK